MRWTMATAVLGCVLAAPTLAQPDPREPLLRVSAVGEARADPDEAVADFAVETIAATAREAAAQNARRMEAVLAALVRAGVPRERIETRSYAVFPDYEHRPEGEPRIRGYRVVNNVVATLHDLSSVGAVIDAALAAGANRVGGVRFGLRDPQQHRGRAIEDAVSRARADASAMARALGGRVGAVREATTVQADAFPPPMPYARMEMAQDVTTPVLPSEQVIRAQVIVTFAFVP
jgi:uncharacterized protein